jgi:hypothetical protein
MPDTKGRPGSKDWIEYWFPEYIHEGKPIRLKTGVGRITGHEQTEETSPWKYAQNEYKKINIYGIITTPVPGKWYNDYLREPVTTKEYEAFITSLNFYRNGGLTMSGKVPGLDPVELIGGFRGVSSPRRRRRPVIYHCLNGTYQPLTYGYPAVFHFNSGEVWTGDHQLKDYDWVKHV